MLWRLKKLKSPFCGPTLFFSGYLNFIPLLLPSLGQLSIRLTAVCTADPHLSSLQTLISAGQDLSKNAEEKSANHHSRWWKLFGLDLVTTSTRKYANFSKLIMYFELWASFLWAQQWAPSYTAAHASQASAFSSHQTQTPGPENIILGKPSKYKSFLYIFIFFYFFTFFKILHSEYRLLGWKYGGGSNQNVRNVKFLLCHFGHG